MTTSHGRSSELLVVVAFRIWKVHLGDGGIGIAELYGACTLLLGS